jgi:hypothetical protein
VIAVDNTGLSLRALQQVGKPANTLVMELRSNLLIGTASNFTVAANNGSKGFRVIRIEGKRFSLVADFSVQGVISALSARFDRNSQVLIISTIEGMSINTYPIQVVQLKIAFAGNEEPITVSAGSIIGEAGATVK